MVKEIKTHINLASQGEYEFLTAVSFEDGQSECLRIKEVRLRHRSGEKPYSLPLKLLTWFTEHAPAGREITRDDNNQQNEAALYISLTDLREQIETFTLKSPFTLELEISELNRDDESTMRQDRGFLALEVNIYKGPKAGCTIKAETLDKEGKSLIYPTHAGLAGRFDLATASLRADQGPLDPRTDKRVILCNLKMPEAFNHLRHAMMERLSLFNGDTPAPSRYIRDVHHYAELYEGQPLDQRTDFPDGVAVFGPLLPTAPKEKAHPLIITLDAPLHTPFWQDLHSGLKQRGEKALELELELILPEPGGNEVRRLQLVISMDNQDWLLITDGAAQGLPVMIPVKRSQQNNEDTTNYSLKFPVNTIEPPVSAFIAVQYYGGGISDEPVNISLTPAKKDTKFVTMKPEVMELTSNERQMLLLNSFALNKRLKHQRSSFRLKCFWPADQRTETATVTIEKRLKRPGPTAAIDIGSAAITMAESRSSRASILPLGQLAPQNYIANCAIPSTVSITSGAPAVAGGEAEISESNWRKEIDPLSFGYQILPWEENGLMARVKHTNRHYDISLPAAPELAPAGIHHSNLKRLFTADSKPEQSAKGEYYLKKAAEQPSEDETFILGRELERTELLADCLDELYSYYGDHLTRDIPQTQSPTTKDKSQNTADEETGPEKEVRLNGLPSSLIVTYPGHLSESGKERYRTAASTALANYDQGSFRGFGPIAELIDLEGREKCEARIDLINETEAAAYQCLHQLALKEQPARARKVRLIHLDIGAAHLGLVAVGGWIGETQAQIDQTHGAVTLPLGGRALELALFKEIGEVISTAINSGAEISLSAPLPGTIEDIIAASTGRNENQRAHAALISSLRQALITVEPSSNKETDFTICLAKSSSANSDVIWPVTVKLPDDYTGKPLRLWQGLAGEQLTLSPTGKNQQEGAADEWQLDLHISTKRVSERVGPLSTYLAFISEFLPLVIANSFPGDTSEAELLISVTGGSSLFAPLRNNIEQTAKRLGCRLAFLPASYEEAATASATGALDMIINQGRAPHHQVRTNLLLAPLSAEGQTSSDLIAIAAPGNLAIIREETASGELPIGCASVQLIETIPGLGRVMQQTPDALSCRYFMQDLDRASPSQWRVAEEEWSSWLAQCHQVMLNMPVAQSELDESSQKPTRWAYRALKENEANLTLADHTYLIYSGLSNSAL